MADLQCPYCEKDIDVCHDDGFGYDENVKHEMQCGYCHKSFVFETTIVFYYEPYKADCLNDSEHKYKPTHTAPIEYTKMECEECGHRRTPTPEEMDVIINKRKP